MARLPRLQIPGGIYHTTARGTEGRVIFPDGDGGWFFLHLLGKVVERYGWHCHAYCPMPNHFHPAHRDAVRYPKKCELK